MLYSSSDCKSILETFQRLEKSECIQDNDRIFIQPENITYSVDVPAKYFRQNRNDVINRMIEILEKNIIGHFNIVYMYKKD